MFFCGLLFSPLTCIRLLYNPVLMLHWHCACFQACMKIPSSVLLDGKNKPTAEKHYRFSVYCRSSGFHTGCPYPIISVPVTFFCLHQNPIWIIGSMHGWWCIPLRITMIRHSFFRPLADQTNHHMVPKQTYPTCMFLMIKMRFFGHSSPELINLSGLRALLQIRV